MAPKKTRASERSGMGGSGGDGGDRGTRVQSLLFEFDTAAQVVTLEPLDPVPLNPSQLLLLFHMAAKFEDATPN